MLVRSIQIWATTTITDSRELELACRLNVFTYLNITILTDFANGGILRVILRVFKAIDFTSCHGKVYKIFSITYSN